MAKMSEYVRVFAVATALSVAPVSAATFDVTQGLWGDASTANSFAWAIDQANTTPGADTIRLFSDVVVDNAPINNLSGFLTEITDTAGVSIHGNGYALVGNPIFTTYFGDVVTKTSPKPYDKDRDSILIPAFSFARIADGVSHVNFDRFTVDGLNAFLNVGMNSVVNIVDSTIKNSISVGFNARPVITALTGSTVNLTEVALNRLNPFDERSFGTEYDWPRPAILGTDATLNIFKSKLELAVTSSTSGAVNWIGGTANVVSSVILGEGLSIRDLTTQGVLNVVNSIFRPSGDTAIARIQAYAGGVANIIASTIQFDAADSSIPNSRFCPGVYPCAGSPLQVFNNGEINLRSSASSVLNDGLFQIQFPYSNQYDTQTGAPVSGSFTADPFSYVQPVTNQNAADLKLLFNQPNLITALVAYALDPVSSFLPTFYNLPAGAYPIASGPLIGVIPDADSLNQLINPIDGSVITTDVFGNPRTSNGRRDVGAVQQAAPVPAPLALLGFGAAFGWSRRLRASSSPRRQQARRCRQWPGPGGSDRDRRADGAHAGTTGPGPADLPGQFKGSNRERGGRLTPQPSPPMGGPGSAETPRRSD